MSKVYYTYDVNYGTTRLRRTIYQLPDRNTG